jgi:hypothetical protein
VLLVAGRIMAGVLKEMEELVDFLGSSRIDVRPMESLLDNLNMQRVV